MRKFRRIISDFFLQTKRFWFALLVLLFMLFCILYFEYYTYLTTDSNSALYLLSTIAQSSASIVAIVISLSLLVIQYSASTYSARVVDIFKNDLRLWALIFFYGFSIIFSLIVIRLINASSDEYSYLGINCLEICYTLALVLSIAAYISLIAYIPYVLKMMKSSSVIDVLSDKIDIKSLSNSSYEVVERERKIPKKEPRIKRIDINLNGEKDPVLPIIDIIRSSIMRYEYDTARYGLEAVKRRLLITLIQNPSEEKRISEHVFKRILEIWNLAFRNKDLEFIEMVLTQYCDIGELCTRPIGQSDPLHINSLLKWLSKALIPLCNALSISHVGEKPIESNFLYTTFLSEYYLKQAFKLIVRVREEEFQSLSIGIVRCIHGIGLDTFRNRYELRNDDKIKVLECLESSISELSYFLRDIGVTAINANSKRAVDEVISALYDIGEASIDNNLIHSIFHILKSLNVIGEESAKNGAEFESSTEQVVECLEKLAFRINANSERLTDETQNQMIEYYEYVRSNYHTYGITRDTVDELNNRIECMTRAYISSYVYTIGKESIKYNLLNATRKCLKSLEVIERILKNGTNSRHIGENTRYLGLEAVKKEQTYPLMEDIVKSLYSLGMLQFGYMFDWDRDREKKSKFIEEYSIYLKRESQISYSDFENLIYFKDFEDIDNKEKTLIIDDKRIQDIKCIFLKDIEDGYHEYRTLKLFKTGIFEKSEKAYYKIPELLEELADPILEYALNSPSDKTIKPFTMIIQSFENFGILSIYFRDKFSLIERIRSLMNIEDSFTDKKYSKYKNNQIAGEYLDWVATCISKSLYTLAVECLKCNFIDYSTLHRQMESLIWIQKEYPNSLYGVVSKFEKISEMISNSELAESERDKIVKAIESAIEELKQKSE